MSDPDSRAIETHPWCWIDDAGLYIRPRNGRWLVCGCEERTGPPPRGPGSTGESDVDWQSVVQERLWQHLPALRGVALNPGWSGLRTFASDRRAMLGPDPDLAGLYWAAGVGGFGVSTCLAVGEFVSDQIHGRPSPWINAEDVAPGRFLGGRMPIRDDGSLAGLRLIRI